MYREIWKNDIYKLNKQIINNFEKIEEIIKYYIISKNLIIVSYLRTLMKL